MALDMEQLRRIFYEECRENLEVLERELLALDPDGDVDLDIINTIFRAAHSIKGGGATFNLNEISQFTHVMETLLDEAREGKRQLDADTIDLLLKGGDCINSMLVAYETDADFDHELRDDLTKQLNQLLGGDSPDEAQPSATSDEATPTEGDGDWVIRFIPNKDMFFSGNDPVRILRELFDLGVHCSVECITDDLPFFSELEPEMCYLKWHIVVDGELEKQLIEEIFEWVEDECSLEISKLDTNTSGSGHAESSDASGNETSKAASEPAAESARRASVT
ncbi:Hpt domain-containing protein [Enterovibrio sp. Hal110]